MAKDLGIQLDEHLENVDHQELSTQKANPADLTCASTVSVTIGSRSSEGKVSFAGQVNDRLGTLLEYVEVGSDSVDVGVALATISGYEILTKNNKKFTVSSILFTFIAFTFFLNK